MFKVEEEYDKRHLIKDRGDKCTGNLGCVRLLHLDGKDIVLVCYFSPYIPTSTLFDTLPDGLFW